MLQFLIYVDVPNVFTLIILWGFFFCFYQCFTSHQSLIPNVRILERWPAYSCFLSRLFRTNILAIMETSDKQPDFKKPGISFHQLTPQLQEPGVSNSKKKIHCSSLGATFGNTSTTVQLVFFASLCGAVSFLKFEPERREALQGCLERARKLD